MQLRLDWPCDHYKDTDRIEMRSTRHDYLADYLDSLDKLYFVGAADCERAVLAFLIGARLSPGG